MGYWRNATTYEEGSGARRTVTIGIKPRAFDRPTPGGGSVLTAIPPQFGSTGDAQLPHGRSGLLDTRFADRLAGQSPQVHVGRGNSHLRMSALGTNNNVAGIPLLDGTGKVIGRRYNNAWNNADLEWLDGGHFVRKQIYLRAGYPQVIEIRVDDHSGNIVPSSRGWDLQDDAGRPVLWAGRGYLYRPDDPLAATVPVPTTVRVQGGKQIYRYELPAGNWAGWVLEPTWTSQPGAAEGQDTLIYGGSAGNPTFNYGIANATQAGQSSANTVFRGLIAFSFAGILGRITSASLTLVIVTINANASNDTLGIRQALTQWYEGAKSGAAPDAGQDGSTWNLRNANGSVAWAGGAGGGSETDYTAAMMGSVLYSAGNTGPKVISLEPTIIEAQRTGINYGMWLLANEAQTLRLIQVDSSDSLTAANRPTLTVVYSLASGGIGRGRGGVLGRL